MTARKIIIFPILNKHRSNQKNIRYEFCVDFTLKYHMVTIWSSLGGVSPQRNLKNLIQYCFKVAFNGGKFKSAKRFKVISAKILEKNVISISITSKYCCK